MSETSENEETQGYVVEGQLTTAVRGYLVLYSVTGGRVSYTTFANNARELELPRSFVPPIRRTKDSFAIAKNTLTGMALPNLENVEGWDGVVKQEILVERLKKGNEYAVQIKRSGRSRGKRHTERVNLFRLEFSPPENFDAASWCQSYMDSHWEEGIEAPSMSSIRRCLTIEPYWDEEDFDPNMMQTIQQRLLDHFEVVATSIDAKMLRDRLRRVLASNMKGFPFRSGQGAWFVPNSEEDNTLGSLEDYSNLLESFGTANMLSGDPTEESWFDETGKPRDWYRPSTNLRILGYIDNDRQLEYIRNDIQNNLSREIAEYQSKIVKLADSFNEDKVEAFEDRLNNIQVVKEELVTRLANLSDMIGGVEVSTVVFSDLNESFTGRLDSIQPLNSTVANRLRGLMDFSEDED
ncbi:MAG: hypothetical protein CMB45_05025 [Euryarchaeota archaeon]|nr:hypothetical protein [Euryarchaeota archaeon]|tara:strand:- start:20454 stop:21677 length:1224 start_codon:yes stop_codon:yes gene_type:complete